MAVMIRPYRRSDRPAIAEICVRTGAAGGDATGRYPDGLLAEIFALPYLELEPGRALVLADSDPDPDPDAHAHPAERPVAGSGGPGVEPRADRVVGYVLGTADTAAFVQRFATEWLPRIAARRPAPTGPPQTPAEWLTGLLHDPQRMLLPILDRYPAHLHIDLLPSHQRGGHGRALLTAYLAGLAADGVAGVHLTMDPRNTGARAFYDRMGFQELDVAGQVAGSVLVRTTDTPRPTPSS